MPSADLPTGQQNRLSQQGATIRSPLPNGLSKAVEDFAPSAHGFAVELVAADHQQKPDVGADIARQWFDRDEIDMIADVNNTAITSADQAFRPMADGGCSFIRG